MIVKSKKMRVSAALVLAVAGICTAGAAVAQVQNLYNPYGLQALWQQGDGIAKTTLLILLLMSMASWYVIITKWLAQMAMARFAKTAQDQFWRAGTVRQGADALQEGSPFRFIAEKGLEGASKHEGLMQVVDFNTWVTTSIQRAIVQV